MSGMRESLEDLSRHTLLSWTLVGDEGRSWPMLNGSRFPVKPILISEDPQAIRECVENGLELAMMPHTRLLDSHLTVVLPNLFGQPRRLWLAIAPASRWSPRVRAFLGVVDAVANVVLPRLDVHAIAPISCFPDEG